MTYQVLARKWRPQTFQTLVGQEHVVKALTHALSTQRLHHAYLFTGTRGVGKTTLSRILAKALNCETGITSTPCGVCGACTDIDAGIFTDYVEMDAASNRGVEDMAALLDRAAYAPVRGRFKIYMIDEVHMLSNTAFNSMLKTLEEPPAYLKFILATTDPQKIPVTVLSRCLQFSLKPMSADLVTSHLSYVLSQENIVAEPAALEAIGRAAQGSMRDALSILDQAIAHGSGQVSAQGVSQMLGVADTSGVYTLLNAIAVSDMSQALARGQALLDAGIGAANIMQELASLACRLAVLQFSGATAQLSYADQQLMQAGGVLTPEHVQLIYGLAIRGAQDAAYAPNDYAAMAMPILRMGVFAPKSSQGASATLGGQPQTANIDAPAVINRPSAAVAVTNPVSDSALISNNDQTKTSAVHSQALTAPAGAQIPAKANTDNRSSLLLSSPQDWPSVANSLPLAALARTAARQSACTSIAGHVVNLELPTSQLAEPAIIQRVQDALRSMSGQPYVLKATVVDAQVHSLSQTASAKDHAVKVEVHQKTEQAFYEDPLVQGLTALGAHVVAGTFKVTPTE